MLEKSRFMSAQNGVRSIVTILRTPLPAAHEPSSLKP